MAITTKYNVDGYTFTFNCNTGFSDGVVLTNVKQLEDAEYLTALKTALKHFPLIQQYHLTMEYVEAYDEDYHDSTFVSYLVDKIRDLEDIELESGIKLPESLAQEFHAIKNKALDTQFRLSKKAKVNKPAEIKGWVYLLKSPLGAFKIGRTKNPNDRLKTFKTSLPFEVEYLHLIETPDMVGLEQVLHLRYHNKRVNGEWFNLSPDDVAYIKGL